MTATGYTTEHPFFLLAYAEYKIILHLIILFPTEDRHPKLEYDKLCRQQDVPEIVITMSLTCRRVNARAGDKARSTGDGGVPRGEVVAAPLELRQGVRQRSPGRDHSSPPGRSPVVPAVLVAFAALEVARRGARLAADHVDDDPAAVGVQLHEVAVVGVPVTSAAAGDGHRARTGRRGRGRGRERQAGEVAVVLRWGTA